MVSEIFDATCWQALPGFDFQDLTYHRAVEPGTVRLAFDRPEVRNVFCPRRIGSISGLLGSCAARDVMEVPLGASVAGGSGYFGMP